jgi:uncharacterized protein YndB with AHSA1/START domain
VSQPAASQHLKVLRDAGLVRGRVEGRRRLYRVDGEGLERLRRELDAYWGPALAALKDAAETGERPWVGPHAVADPEPGGDLRWTHPNGATVIGRFVELVPHRRVVFTYGWEDGRMGVLPGSTTVEIDLVEEEGATTLRLVHHGLPPDAVDDHERGWAYFLGALRETVTAG